MNLPRLEAQLADIFSQSESSDAPRLHLIRDLKGWCKEARRSIRDAFEAGQLGAISAARQLSDMHDVLIRGLFAHATEVLFPMHIRTSGEYIAVIAVGGYGRGTLAPHSDLDLLFVIPYKENAWVESVVETMLYVLWDLGLKVGYSVRSVDECLRQGRTDMTIRTTLLERRYLCGERPLAEELNRRLWSELFANTGSEFIAAKLDEREARHERSGGSRYLLEPNIKESKGGLRDLHSLFWIAKYLYHAQSADDLVAAGVFSSGEARKFARAENFLWTVRFWLHYLAGRAQEHLTFDQQVEIAAKIGFRSDSGRSPVERFMKCYFIHARGVGGLTRIFCATLEAQHVIGRRDVGQRIAGFVRQFLPGDQIQIRGGRIYADRPEIFAQEPLNILRVFKMSADGKFPVHPDTLRALRREGRLIDTLRDNPEANRLFLDILTSKGEPVKALRMMNELGLLERLIPEWAHIVCQMQFNMYHHYTVDEHTLEALDVLARIERGEEKTAHPLASSILTQQFDRDVLYVALLLHDLGKGRPEDHSIAGERLAIQLCPRLGLKPAQTAAVAWLVRHHLLMSDVAQKRDLSDIQTIRDFVAVVKSSTRLRLLLPLSVADIRGVGPGVWNNWKAQLLRQLYQEANAMISGGVSAMSNGRGDREEQARQALLERIGDLPEASRDAFMEQHYAAYWLGLDTDTHEEHARMLAGAEDEKLVVVVKPDPEHSMAKISVSMADHPGLFSRMTGAFALAGASITDAKSFTTRSGAALNTFWLQDRDDGTYDDPARVKRLHSIVERTLKGEIIPRNEILERRRVKKREAAFTVPPEVVVDNDASELYTMVEVTGRDRLGLVHDLARAFADENVSIFTAVIATYGEQAVDTFYVKDIYGHKLHHEVRQARLKNRLLEALAGPGESQGRVS